MFLLLFLPHDMSALYGGVCSLAVLRLIAMHSVCDNNYYLALTLLSVTQHEINSI